MGSATIQSQDSPPSTTQIEGLRGLKILDRNDDDGILDETLYARKSCVVDFDQDTPVYSPFCNQIQTINIDKAVG